GGIWRGLLGNTTAPTKAAPPSSAASSVSGVVRPQILVSVMRQAGARLWGRGQARPFLPAHPGGRRGPALWRQTRRMGLSLGPGVRRDELELGVEDRGGLILVQQPPRTRRQIVAQR